MTTEEQIKQAAWDSAEYSVDDSIRNFVWTSVRNSAANTVGDSASAKLKEYDFLGQSEETP
mgnify:CR=1 FL=1